MLRTLAAMIILALASPAFANDKPKPNTLTQKEIADGWILLFDGETTFGWKIDGAAEVKDGVLILGKGKKTTAQLATNFQYLRAEMQLQGKAVVYFDSHNREIDAHDAANDSNQWTKLELTRDRTPNTPFTDFTVAGGFSSEQRDKPEQPELKSTPFLIETDGKTEFRIRNAKLHPRQATPLFTGKNLDGWKINAADPKRMASKWDVTNDGELSLKNGPGDLVTERDFDNFVLQLECKTLGKALNSGVFFRCIPGQYQNGYEAQIQNAYKDNDRTKPNDFGTGAIYRRVPARKVVANDNEWFTMTVVANGKHISTWVNGYQTVDWTDDRKESVNPRTGYRAAKGPISIQGHDPTTDLLFRNFRIAEIR